MDLPDDVRADLSVAAVAAGATVALSLALRYGLGAQVGPLFRLGPLVVYFAYLLFGKGETGSAFENPRLWQLLAVVVAVGTLLYFAG